MDWKEVVTELRDEIKCKAHTIVQAARDSDRSDRDLEKFVESEIQDVMTFCLFAHGSLCRTEP